MTKQTGPACGNNPNYRMTDRDRQAVTEFRAYLTRRSALLDAAETADQMSMEIEQTLKAREVGPLTALQDLADKLRRMAADVALSPYYKHPECGFHWHGRDGMDIPMRDGQPVCPRCELRRMADETPATETETPRAALERVRERCQAVRDRVGPRGMINASQILGLLSPTWPDGNFEAGARQDDETPAWARTEQCAHCGQPISRVTGTLTAWWVHNPGGNTICDWARAAASPRATPTATEAQHDEPWPVKEATRRYAEQLRATPGQASRDGHTGWECDAGASLLIAASTLGPGALGTHHGTIYSCALHQGAALQRITGSGYEADPQPAPPGHRWNPWPCGHVTAHDAEALAALTAAGARQDGAHR
ncbi:hypothetical protein [Streptomyces sp. NPDC048392]|uniref:hypothetical protein n=1 Tax=Streptomyces sp. NPDC048392 TaxID=3365543 RepID=UPI003719EA16